MKLHVLLFADLAIFTSYSGYVEVINSKLLRYRS